MILKYAQASYYYYEDRRAWTLMANVFLFPPPTQRKDFMSCRLPGEEG